jgi:hypothetical protein
MAMVYYGDLDGTAAVFTANEAWLLHGDTWVAAAPVGVNHGARLMTRDEWNAYFKNPPRLPPEAFANGSAP